MMRTLEVVSTARARPDRPGWNAIDAVAAFRRFGDESSVVPSNS
jgi:hypothetical protein